MHEGVNNMWRENQGLRCEIKGARAGEENKKVKEGNKVCRERKGAT